jgi:hypothetical protein
VVETLNLYRVVWPQPLLPVEMVVTEAAAKADMVAGTFLCCARMRVDATEGGLYATAQSGATCSYSIETRRWSIAIPPRESPVVADDVEDLVELVLTTSWRQAGWVAMHLGAAVKGRSCAMLASPSGGGKSTLMTALIRRGWQTLGDDKLLLRQSPGGRPQVAALRHEFNLHPEAREWFPELGDLEQLPVYSPWTPKRRVCITDIWPNTVAAAGAPTHLVRIVRRAEISGVRVSALTRSEVLSTLLHQTVVPNEAQAARHVLTAVAAMARQLEGVRVEIGPDAYRDPRRLAPLEAAIH